MVNSFEIKIEDRTYTMTCPDNASLGECFDICTRFRSYFYNLINEALSKEEVEEEKNGTQ